MQLCPFLYVSFASDKFISALSIQPSQVALQQVLRAGQVGIPFNNFFRKYRVCRFYVDL